MSTKLRFGLGSGKSLNKFPVEMSFESLSEMRVRIAMARRSCSPWEIQKGLSTSQDQLLENLCANQASHWPRKCPNSTWQLAPEHCEGNLEYIILVKDRARSTLMGATLKTKGQNRNWNSNIKITLTNNQNHWLKYRKMMISIHINEMVEAL